MVDSVILCRGLLVAGLSGMTGTTLLKPSTEATRVPQWIGRGLARVAQGRDEAFASGAAAWSGVGLSQRPEPTGLALGGIQLAHGRAGDMQRGELLTLKPVLCAAWTTDVGGRS